MNRTGPGLLGILIAVGICGCDLARPTSELVIAEDIVPPSEMTLSANNGTTENLALVVNGSSVRELAPGTQVTVTAKDLPGLPWQAEVRFPNGRTLVSLAVHAGDVIIGTNYSKGDGARVDLSCGRIDVWSGPPIGGPAPGPGVAGDCKP